MQHQRTIQRHGKGTNNGRAISRTNNGHDVLYGKVPPQAREMEEAVLGAIMLQRGAFDTVVAILKPDCFYILAHQRIYAAMMRLNEKSMPVDILTVVEELKASGDLEQVGGPFYVTRLTNTVVSAANIEAHARIILQKYLQREMIRISGEIMSDAYEDTTDVFDLLDKAEGHLFTLTTGHLQSNYSKVDALYVKETRELEQRMQRGEDVTGVHTGYRALDVVTAGWQPTDLIIIAARPSVGKTAFALNLARNAAMHHKRPVGAAIFSLEMSKGQIMQRLIAMESDYQLDQIRRGKLTPTDLQQLHARCAATIARVPIFIDDTPALNIFELRAKARRMVNKDGVGLIIIDYLQLMSGLTEGRSSNREQEISTISRSLKGLAKELHVPVIALCQLSREIEKRAGKEPQLSDLRESGAIEQDADFVGFLQRADYQQDASSVDPSLQGAAELKIKKHRNGKLETIAFNTDLSVQRFYGEREWREKQRLSGYIPLEEANRRFEQQRPVVPPAEETEPDDLPF